MSILRDIFLSKSAQKYATSAVLAMGALTFAMPFAAHAGGPLEGKDTDNWLCYTGEEQSPINLSHITAKHKNLSEDNIDTNYHSVHHMEVDNDGGALW